MPAPALIRLNKNAPPPSPIRDNPEEVWEKQWQKQQAKKRAPRSPKEHKKKRLDPGTDDSQIVQSSEPSETSELFEIAQKKIEKAHKKKVDKAAKRNLLRQEMELKELRDKYAEARLRIERMKKDSESNKSMVLQLSGVVRALQDISVDYEKTNSTSTSDMFENVQRKIKAIDEQMSEAMLTCGHLQREKSLQCSAIKAYEGQVKSMGDQIDILQQRLDDQRSSNEVNSLALVEAKPMQIELKATVQAQQEKIEALTQQVRRYAEEKRSTVSLEIEALKEKNVSKYAEIEALQARLQAMKAAQATKPSQLVPFQGTLNDNGIPQNAIVPSQSCDLSHTSTLEVIEEEEDETVEECEGEAEYVEILVDSSKHSEVGDNSLFTEESSVYTASKQGSVTSCTTSSSSTSSSSSSSASSQSHNSSVEHTNPTMSMNSGSFERESDKQLRTDYEQLKKKYDKLKESYREATSGPPEKSLLHDELLKLKARNQKLETENKGLRQDHEQALNNMAKRSNQHDYDAIKKQLEEQTQKADLAEERCKKLQTENAKTAQSLERERKRSSQLLNNLEKVADCDEQLQEYIRLQKIHDLVVLKVADMGDEVDELQEKLKLADSEISKLRDDAQELDETKKQLESEKRQYDTLYDEHETLRSQVNKLCDQYEKLRDKYNQAIQNRCSSTEDDPEHDDLKHEYESTLIKLKELEAVGMTSEERWKQENAEAMAKIEMLESTNKELEAVQIKYRATEAKIAMLERNLTKARENAETAQKGQQEKEKVLRDMLFHYKNLQKEHKETSDRLDRLQAVVKEESEGDHAQSKAQVVYDSSLSGANDARASAFQAKIMACERRMQVLAQQRDAAFEQMKQLEENLASAKREASAAVESKKAREQDLKVVLGHYKDLEKKYNEAVAQVKILKGEAVQRLEEINEIICPDPEVDPCKTKEETEGRDEQTTVTSPVEASTANTDEEAILHQEPQGQELEEITQEEETGASVDQIDESCEATTAQSSCEGKPEGPTELQLNGESKAPQQKAPSEPREQSSPSKVSRLKDLFESGAAGSQLPADEMSVQTQDMGTQTEEVPSETEAMGTQTDATGTQTDATDNHTSEIGTHREEAHTQTEDAAESTNQELASSLEKHDGVRAQDPQSKESSSGCGDEGGPSQQQTGVDVSCDEENPALLISEGHNSISYKAAPVECEVFHADESSQPYDENENDGDDADSVIQLLMDMKQLTGQNQTCGPAETSKESSDVPPTSVSGVKSFDSNEDSVSSSPGSESVWKDHKIAEVMSDLQKANERANHLAEKHREAKTKLDIMERKLFVAKREADDAKNKQTAREVNLRDIITQHKKLERAHKEVLGTVVDLKEQLEHAKREVRLRREEAKSAQQRSTGLHVQCRKLQGHNEEAKKTIAKLQEELKGYKFDTKFVGDTSAVRKFRIDMMQEKVRLLKENEEMKAKLEVLSRKPQH